MTSLTDKQMVVFLKHLRDESAATVMSVQQSLTSINQQIACLTATRVALNDELARATQRVEAVRRIQDLQVKGLAPKAFFVEGQAIVFETEDTGYSVFVATQIGDETTNP